MSASAEKQTKPSPMARLGEWLWRGAAIRAATLTEPAPSLLSFCEQRARTTGEVAMRTLSTVEPWRSGDVSHIAASLLAESVGWCLRASRLRTGGPDAGDRSWPTRPPEGEELSGLVAEHRTLLLEAAGHDAERLERVVRHMLERDFERNAVSKRELGLTASELSQVATRLLAQLPLVESIANKAKLERATRLGALTLVLLALLAGGAQLSKRLEDRRNVAAGKPWRASSQYETGCTSPAQSCGKGFFFHTREEASPWLELDLSSEQRISRLSISNRTDCCGDRALPLVVEVSSDRENWQEVARRTKAFSVWRPRFTAVSARWVRLRVARRSFLHLAEVRVLPAS